MRGESPERLSTNPYQSPSSDAINPLRPAASTLSAVLLPIVAVVFASGGVIAFFIVDRYPPFVKVHDPWSVVFCPVVLIAIGGCCVLCFRQGVTRVIAVIGIVINLGTLLTVWGALFVMWLALR